MLPFNFLGKGILSAPTVTTIPRSGAAPTYTTASGTALQTGIAGWVDEQQVITTVGCKNSTWNLGYNVRVSSSWRSYLSSSHMLRCCLLVIHGQSTARNATFSNNMTAAQLAATLMRMQPGGMTVLVERYDNVSSGPNAIQDRVSWLVTFVGQQHVPLLYAAPGGISAPGCGVSVAVFLQGNVNSFTIEPKQASGETLVDSATPR